ncbi:YdeI/OmpD-associated family protein [Pseudolysinimonas sp.]|uniref:YdeI/OmpD-associated family protein n=1 Tax=Pseudolysinimonas sp. TaxID=2680009 RepID=UPI003F7EBEC6
MPTFTWTLESQGGNNTGFVVPEDVVLAFGRGRRVPVVVTIGDYTYRTTIVSMGGRFLFGVNAQQRTDTGLAAGDVVTLTIEPDDAPREVEMPAELQAALDADPAAKAAFEKLSFTNRKEAARQVGEAKAEETRARRIAKILDSLRG